MWKKLGVILIGLLTTFSVAYALDDELKASANDRPFNMNFGSSIYFTSPNKDTSTSNGTPVEWIVIANDFPGKRESLNYVSLINKDPVGKLTEYGPNSSDYGPSAVRKLITDTYNTSTLTSLEQNIIVKHLGHNSNGTTLNPEIEDSNGDFAVLPTANELVPYGQWINSYGNDGNTYGGEGTGVFFDSITEVRSILLKIRSTEYVWTRNTAAGRIINPSALVVWQLLQGTNQDGYFGSMLYKGRLADTLSIMRLDYAQLSLATPLKDDAVVSWKDNDTKKGAQLSIINNDETTKVALKDDTINVSINDIPTKVSNVNADVFKIGYDIQGANPANNKFLNMVLTQEIGGIETVVYAARIADASGNEVLVSSEGLPLGIYNARFFYEEVNQGVTNYNIASAITKRYPIEVVEGLSNLAYTPTPSMGLTHYEYDKNTAVNEVIGTITSKNGVPDISYDILPATSGKDVSESLKVEVINGKPVVKITNNLEVGIHRFRIQAFDKNKSPSIPTTIDSEGNLIPLVCRNESDAVVDCINADGTKLEYGLVTEEIEFIVYPNDSIINFTPTKKDVNGELRNWNTTDIHDTPSKVIGNASLNPDPTTGANPIFDSTMDIEYSIKDVKLNGTSIPTGSEDFQIDKYTGAIIKKNTLTDISYGEHKFTLSVSYTKDGKTDRTVTIDKTNCSFYIDPVLYFVDTKDNTNKITEFEIKHDDTAGTHNFTVLANSDSPQVTSSTNLKYRIKPVVETDTTVYIKQIKNNLNQFETVFPGEVYIEAYYTEMIDGKIVEIVTTKLKVKVTTDAISDLKFTVTPQNNSANKAMDHLSYKQNTKKDDIIAKISSKGGTKPITYNLSDTDNFTLKDNPDTATNTTQKYVTDVDGNVLVYAKKDLEIGAYPLIIQAYDDLGQPLYSDDNGNATFGIDENGNKISGYDKGLISESYEIVVYPNETQANITQEKKYSGTAKEQFFTEVDIKADLTKTLGSIDFTNDAKVDALRNAGYVIQEVKLVNKATTTPYTQLNVEQDGTNKNKYNIKANSTITGGTKEFDVIITFKKTSDTAVTATITKSNQSLYFENELNYINPDKQSEFLSNKQYSKVYEPDTSKGNNLFKLLATEKLGTTNPKVKYCILKNDACDSATNTILTLTQGSGEAEATVLPTGTDKKQISVRAYLEDTDGVYLTSQDIDLTILPAKQELQWVGENIQVANNNITKDTTTPATWLLNLKYDEQTTPITPGINEYAFVKAYDKTALQKGKIMIRSNVLEDNTTPAPTLNFSYSITYDVQKDRGKIDEVELANGNLVIKGELEGNVSITATASATGDYDATINEDDPYTTVVEELGSATLRLSVTSKPKVDFKFAYTSSSIFNGDDYAKGINSLGTLSLKPSDTKYEYTISNTTVLDEEATANAKKLDPLAEDVYIPYVKDNFILKLNGAGTLSDQLYVNKSRIPNGLPAGTYLVTIEAERTIDGVKLEAIPKVVTIVVNAQSIDYEKLEWQSKDSSNTSNFAPVNGILVQDTNTKEIMNSVALEMVYKGTDSNGNPGYFYVILMDTDALTLTDTTIEYAITDDSTPNIISFQTTDDAENGKVSIHGVSTGTSVLKIKATIKKTGYEDLIVYLPITIKKATPEMKFVKGDAKVYQLVNSKDTSLYKNLDVTYSEGASIDVFTANANAESDITLSIESTTTTTGNDVLKFKDDEATTNDDKDNPKTCVITKEEYASKRLSKCQTFIENAMDKTSDKGTIIVKAATIATTNYEAFEIRMPINIDKATQDDFNFAVSDLDVESNDKGAVEPKFLEHVVGNDNLKIGKGKITLLLANSDGTPPDFTSDEVSFDSNEFDRDDKIYSDGYKTYAYNIVVGKDDPERIVHVYARKEGDRNYKASDEKELALHVQPEGTSVFKTKIESYPAIGKPPVQNTITYGDEYFSIVASSPDDENDEKATYTYTFADEYKDVIESYTDNGETNEFKPKKAKDEVVIKITRTSGTGTVVNSSIKIKIQKKVVKLKVADVEKINGQMVVAKDDYAFTNTSTAFLEKDKNDIVITYSCQDDKAVEVDTLVDGIRVKHNQIPIKATIKNKVASNDVLSNYSIKHLDGKTDNVEDGKLIVTQEESQKTWYEVKEGSQVNDKGEAIITSKGQNDWYNGNIDIELKAVANDYDLISNDEDGKDWRSDKFTVDKNGTNAVDVYFRKSSGDDKDAISKPQSETIKIDTVAPKIKEIKATLTHTDNLSKIVHALTFGMFMKPGEEVTIKTEDIQADKTIQVSTTSGVTDGMLYKAYVVGGNGNRGSEYIPTTKGDTSSDGTYVFDLKDPGTYEVCAIVKDQAGNASVESCEKLLVKKIDFDGDDDGDLDYLDPDEDGCPDIDIVLQDKDKKKYKINVDRDEEGIPDLNIDSDGDGIAEINVDTDKDGKPDLNLVILTKWEPTFCAKEQMDDEGKPIEYCTMKDIKPLINVDTGKDGVPDINIDTGSDMKADINIDRNGDGKLDTRDLNITGKIKVWSPDQDYTYEDFDYDTQNDLIPRINVDTTGKEKPDLNIDTDDDGLPDLNIDANGDGIPETNIDSDGDGVADFNLDPDRTGTPQSNIIEMKTWKPEVEGEIDGIHYLTMGGLALNDTLTDDDSGIQIQKPGGSFLPNYSIKVGNVKDTIDETEKDKIKEYVNDDTEIKEIYDVELSDGTSVIQPDGSIKVRIPVSEDLANVNTVKVILEQADGSYKEVSATIKDGFIEYETGYLGKVGIIADKAKVEEPNPDKPDVPIPDFKPNGSGGSTPDTSVKGNYTSGIGGAGTGDTHNINILLLSFMICASGMMIFIVKKRMKN